MWVWEVRRWIGRFVGWCKKKEFNGRELQERRKGKVNYHPRIRKYLEKKNGQKKKKKKMILRFGFSFALQLNLTLSLGSIEKLIHISIWFRKRSLFEFETWFRKRSQHWVSDFYWIQFIWNWVFQLKSLFWLKLWIEILSVKEFI